MKSKHKKIKNNEEGFTLIELMTVVGIIALLAAVVLVALTNARQKSRNTKRLADMVQINNGLELFNSYNKGYPDVASGTPIGLATQFMTTIPQDPGGSEGVCDSAIYPSGGANQPPAGTPATEYYYVPYGNSFTVGSQKLWGNYNYYFCLSDSSGNFPAGIHIMTPGGVQ